jgi:hypothetical protein
MHMFISTLEQSGELFKRGMVANNLDLSRFAACEKGAKASQAHMQLKRRIYDVNHGACDARSAKAMCIVAGIQHPKDARVAAETDIDAVDDIWEAGPEPTADGWDGLQVTTTSIS